MADSDRPEPEFETGASDDAVIGRALKWSVGAFLVLGLVVGAILFLLRPRDPRVGRVTPLLAPREPHAETGLEMPVARFVDVTRAVGVSFRHENGADGEKLLPETMGAGVAFFDADADGDPDLLLVNGARWSWSERRASEVPAQHAFYRNDGGAFTDVTASAGLGGGYQGMGVACGDFDNDGLTDVFISGVGEARLLRNEGGGRFLDVTEASGIRMNPEDWGTSAAFVDFDRDGRLDLFLCQYVRWSRSIDVEVDYRLVGIGRAYGPPMNFPGSYSRLWRNAGGGRFEEISEKSGIQIRNRATQLPMGKALGVAPVDFNGDGWIDLIVANDTVQNFAFSNRWDGTFAEVGVQSGLAFDTFGGTRGAMGIDSGRFSEDESLGISIGNFANEMLALYVAQPDTLMFADEAIAQGVGASSRQSLSFGVFFFDYDLDGWLDLMTVNGHIEESIERVQASQRYAQPAQLFWNSRGVRRGGGFVPLSPTHAGQDLFTPVVGRGSAYADIDGDGDLDVVITQVAGHPVILRNQQDLGHRWVRFRLKGTRSNRDAIGAWVRLRGARQTQWRQVMPTRGYLSQSELPVTFGLGELETVKSVEISWPSGMRQVLPGASIRLGSTMEIVEPAP